MKTTYTALKRFVIATLFTVSTLSGWAQQKIDGIIIDLQSNKVIQQASIRNLTNQQQTSSNEEGKFSISAKMNDHLSIEAPGYGIDTVFLYQDGVQRIYMISQDNDIRLDEVLIQRLTDSRLDAEIKRAANNGQVLEADQNRGGIRFSPSRKFGKEGKLARQHHALLIQEKNQRAVDRVFTSELIGSILPLTASEVPLFKERFRPSLEFIQNASIDDLKVYIMDSYKKFK